MGFIIALIVFGCVTLGATHINHTHQENAALQQKVQVLEAQTDGSNLHIDGVPVRNLSDE